MAMGHRRRPLELNKCTVHVWGRCLGTMWPSGRTNRLEMGAHSTCVQFSADRAAPPPLLPGSTLEQTCTALDCRFGQRQGTDSTCRSLGSGVRWYLNDATVRTL